MDENLPQSAGELLRAAGHDVREALSEGLGGAEDAAVLAACQREGRALVTLDKDLLDVRTYPPTAYSGILVLRPRDQRASTLGTVLARVLPFLNTEQLSGTLWVVDEHRVRIRR
jgi:predicted nuclease of predicted toxin-antitoxin system